MPLEVSFLLISFENTVLPVRVADFDILFYFILSSS